MVQLYGEGAGTAPIEVLPDEILQCAHIAVRCDVDALCPASLQEMARKMCPESKNVHLDFGRCGWKNVPLEILAGGFGSADDAAAAAAAGGVAASAGREGWASGMCDLFPRTKSITMGTWQEIGDAHVIALADKYYKYCGLKHANFGRCTSLTDAVLVALANMCPGLKHADFW